MSILDTLMGRSNYRAKPVAVDTSAGTQAIQDTAARGADQAQSGAYSLAANARGPTQGLAFREAQRRGAQASADIYSEGIAAQQQLEQQAAMERARSAMAAQQINAQTAQQNAGGLQRFAGSALMAGAMFSDYRQKEPATGMYSDFRDKQPASLYERALANAQPDPEPTLSDRMTAATFETAPRSTWQPTLSEGAQMRVADDPARPAVYRSQPLREGVDPSLLSNAAVNQHLANERYRAALESEAAPVPEATPTPGLTSAQKLGVLGGMLSDFRQKQPTAAQSRADLGSVVPVMYQYTPGSSARQAGELAASPEEAALVYTDKRTPRLGIVAQDLEQSPAFDEAVMDTPAGKAIERDRALSIALAELGGLDKRLRAVEGRGG